MLPDKPEFRRVPSEGIGYGNLHIYPFPLNHPAGATGYRLESEGAVVVHVSDFEHGNAENGLRAAPLRTRRRHSRL